MPRTDNMPAADTRYVTPFGSYELQRYPARRQEILQAWCAADTLLLDAVHESALSGAGLLIANDEHGALSIAARPVALWTDSALAALALARNLTLNASAAGAMEDPPHHQVPVLWSTATPPTGLSAVVMRVPKQLPYFEYQLATLAQVLEPGSQLLAAGMDKHLSPRVAQLLERYIGPTQRHRGQHKARLFTAVRDARPAQPIPDLASYYCELLGARLVAMSNVFSQDKLDGGTRLLLEHLDTQAPAQRVLDLACGNGVLGLAALQRGLAQSAIFCDESAMAVASARANAASAFANQSPEVSFHHGDGMLGYNGELPDLVLCNPPFHLNHTVDDFVGRRLLEHSANHLAAGGRLCLVANRHLNYMPTLKRYFQQVTRVAQNSKFVVWQAIRRG